MSIAHRIAYNVVFNAVAKIFSTVLGLVSIGIITRYLGTSGFGEYSTALAFFALFGALADFGLYSIATREISREHADEKQIMGNVVALRLAVSGVVLGLVPLIVWIFPYSQEVKISIVLVAIAFFMSSSYMVLNGIFQKNLVMDRVALTELVGKVLQVGVIWIAVTFDLGFLAVIASLIIYMTFNAVTVFFLSRRYVQFRLQWDTKFLKSFLREAWPMGASVLITFFYFKFDTILLSWMKESSDVGIYNGAYKILENITFFPAMIIGLVLPLFSRYIKQEKEKFEIVANKVFKVFVILTVPIVAVFYLFAADIISLIVGEDFILSVGVLQILSFALALIFFGHLFTVILIAGNFQRYLMRVLLVCAVFNITANILLIPSLSYVGTAITSVLTEFLVVVLTGVLVYKKISYFPDLEAVGRIIFSGGIMVVFIVFAQERAPFLGVLVGSGLVYLTSIVVFKVINKEELASVFFARKKDSFD